VKRVGRQRFERQKGQQVERYMRALRQGNPRATHSAAQRILPSAKKNSPQPLASVTASMDTVREVDPIAVVPAAWSAGRRPQLVARMAAQLHANALEATFQEGGVADPLLDPDHLRLQEAHVFAAKMHSQCDPEGGSPHLNDQISDDEVVAVLDGVKTGTATLGTSMLALKEVFSGEDDPTRQRRAVGVCPLNGPWQLSALCSKAVARPPVTRSHTGASPSNLLPPNCSSLCSSGA
jgi:hypothetical protein